MGQLQPHFGPLTGSQYCQHTCNICYLIHERCASVIQPCSSRKGEVPDELTLSELGKEPLQWAAFCKFQPRQVPSVQLCLAWKGSLLLPLPAPGKASARTDLASYTYKDRLTHISSQQLLSVSLRRRRMPTAITARIPHVSATGWHFPRKMPGISHSAAINIYATSVAQHLILASAVGKKQKQSEKILVMNLLLHYNALFSTSWIVRQIQFLLGSCR